MERKFINICWSFTRVSASLEKIWGVNNVVTRNLMFCLGLEIKTFSKDKMSTLLKVMTI